MIRLATILIFLIVVINSRAGHAQEIGFVEDFVLAENREEVLKRLVPGTRDYYYFYALHYQNRGQLDQVEQILPNWIKRYGETEKVKVIQNRQALLRFQTDPEKTYQFLRDRLQLNFNHQRQIPAAERNLPVQLDQKLIAADRLRREALRRYGDLAGLENTGLESINAASLDRNRRRHLLSRLEWPDFPNLVSMVVQDLREKDSGGFGSLEIHSRLTLLQLEECLRSLPQLIDNSKFVNTYLGKLQPGDDIAWRSDAEAYRAYLLKLYEFTRRLNPAFNSLKACILYRLLELDLTGGRYDRNRFLEYLKLPRQIGYVHPRMIKDLQSRSHIVNLSADYRKQVKLMPVFNDEALVREYLHHFLLPTEGYEAFRPYIRESWLKKQFATVKILNGIGDPEQWASMLTAEEYRTLLLRVDLDFAKTNAEFFADQDDVQIDLYTKNVPTLIVKIFEINTFNYYRNRKREIDTDINLDGLVPNSEKTYRYDDEPVLRKRRTFTFEDLKNPGVYVVDFIGGGKSSRALIRRGRFSMVGQATAAGQQFRVFDQNQDPVPDATLWISGQTFEPDESGRITMPFSSQPGTRQAIISRGDFSSLQEFAQLGEAYELEAGMYVDRESLLSGQKAKIGIRPGLKISGAPASVKLLSDVQLVITSTDHSGVSSTKRIDKVALSDDRETECEFVVPPNLKKLRFCPVGNRGVCQR